MSAEAAAKLLLANGAIVGGDVLHPSDVIAAALRAHKDGEQIGERLVPPQDKDTVAYLTIRLHSTGALSVQGHIFDKRMAHQMLDHAREAIGRQVVESSGVLIPSRDVAVEPSLPLVPYGDMVPCQRGDG